MQKNIRKLLKKLKKNKKRCYVLVDKENEIVKIKKKNKKDQPKNNKKRKIQKGITDYINN